jgi:hypothetical protein
MPDRSSRLRIALALVVTALTFVVGVSLALAAKEVTSYFGNESGSGSADGEFALPRSVAVNASGAGGVPAGTVYVADSFNHRVQRFDADGTFVSAFGSNGTDVDQFQTPTGIAVDQSDGSLYVYDQDNLRVAKYSAAGTFLFAFGSGVADGATDELQTCTTACFSGLGSTVDGGFGFNFALPGLAVAPAGSPNAGHLLVADPTNNRIQEFDASGTTGPVTFVNKVGAYGSGDGEFEFDGPSRVAVDDAGRVYAIDPWNARVQRFTAALVFDTVFADAELSGFPAPMDIAIDPGATSAGDASDDRVLVIKPCTEDACPGAAVSDEHRIKELGTDGALVDTHAANAGISGFATGVGVNVATDRLYFSATAYGPGHTSAHRVYILEDGVAPPTATIGSVTDVNARGATFNGSVDPEGAPTGYHFEYSDDGSNWTAFPPSDVDAGSGTSAVPVTATVSNALKPSTLYHVRLVAKRTYSGASATSLETTFTTDPAPPAVGAVTTADAEDTTAVLTGRVNPNSQATTYWFEYGTTDSYGSQTSPGNAGSGGDSVVVSEQISGLQPGTTYHYRLVAENASGRTEGADHTFTTRSTAAAGCPNEEFRTGVAAHLPGCRAYEQVSPTDKGGFDISLDSSEALSGGPVAVDGDGVAFRSLGAFAGTPFGGSSGGLPYLSTRGQDAWSTRSLHPRPLEQVLLRTNDVRAFTPDLSLSILSTGVRLLDHPVQNNNYYLQDNSNNALTHLLSFAPTIVYAVASDDLQHLVVDPTGAPLTAEPNQPGSARKVYEATGGQVRLVSREPGTNEPFQSASVIGSGLGTLSSEGAISADGRHIFFTSPFSGDERTIYRRTDGTTTTLASPSERIFPDPNGIRPKVFQVASKDGSRVFFTSAEQLTDNANSSSPSSVFQGDIYRYDVDADELVNLSAGTPGLTAAEVDGVLGIDHAGDRAYFVATGQVVPGEGVAGEPNLYLWEDDGTPQGATRFIATLSGSDSGNWSWGASKMAQVTPDGTHLVFRSVMNVTGYDSGGVAQIYRYDADADGGDGRLECLSCPPGGAAGAAVVPTKANTGGALGQALPKFVSDDGSRVIFSTPDAILPRDGNGRYDAYLWEDGEVFLISSGASSDLSSAYGMSASGDDVFFRTREQLVPADGDKLIDVYTARVNGGLASQQEQARPDCEGEACKGEARTAPPPTTPSSADNHGVGNVRPLPDCGRFTRAAKRLAKRAKTLRRRAANASSEPRATLMRRKATRLSKRAKAQRAKARRCTQRNQASSR